MVTKGEGGRDKLGMWHEQILLCTKQIKEQELLSSTGNYILYLVINYNETESEKVYMSN